MWKTIARKGRDGKKLYMYKIVCNGCGRDYKEKGRVVVFDSICAFGDSEQRGWRLSGDHALCRKCRRYIESEDCDMEAPRLDLKNFNVWKRKNKVQVIEERHGVGVDRVWPTLRANGFRKYNADCDYLNMHDTPRGVAERAIYRGGLPKGVKDYMSVEFVYEFTSLSGDCEYVDIFWREKEK